MRRRVLLVEPNYRNKYPPLGLMKLSTYHKRLGDSVTFFKGEFKQFVLEELYSEVLDRLHRIDASVFWEEHRDLIVRYIEKGFSRDFLCLEGLTKDALAKENLRACHEEYRKKKYLEKPSWDRICITTLFTFDWNETVSTINSFKRKRQIAPT